MNARIAGRIDDLSDDTVVVLPFFAGDDLSDQSDAARLGGDALRAALARGEIRSRLYNLTFFHPDGKNRGLLLVGAGSRQEAEPLILMRVAAAASRYLTGRSYSRIAFLDPRLFEPADLAHAVTEGLMRGAYNPGLKKTHQESNRVLDEAVILSSRDGDELERGMRVGEIVGESSVIARDLVNLPPNELTPMSLAARAADIAQECGLAYEVIDDDGMLERGMGSLLGVAAGSEQPPRLIILRYGDRSAQTRLALVGKGLTFDSGGLSLKPAHGMERMKSDMGGAAAVIAGMAAVSRLAPQNIAVTGYVGATENMPGGAAMRPGDVLTAMNGETIEVLNTDAEGRLVLADVLSLAVQEGATHIVDFATLTGGAVVALGQACTLSTGSPARWVRQVVEGASRGLERAWPMPIFPEYRSAMDSEVADIKNTGGRAASPLTAAAFLGDFVGDVPWTHMDIAGTAFAEESTPYLAVGGTGQGLGTIVGLVRELNGE